MKDFFLNQHRCWMKTGDRELVIAFVWNSSFEYLKTNCDNGLINPSTIHPSLQLRISLTTGDWTRCEMWIMIDWWLTYEFESADFQMREKQWNELENHLEGMDLISMHEYTVNMKREKTHNKYTIRRKEKRGTGGGICTRAE